MCVSYHAWGVSVLESKVQLLTRGAAAQDERKNVLGRNDVTYRQREFNNTNIQLFYIIKEQYFMYYNLTMQF